MFNENRKVIFLIVTFSIISFCIGRLVSRKIQRGNKTTDNKEKQNYRYHTRTYLDDVRGDPDNDGKEQYIELRYSECERIDEEGNSESVGCPGPACVKANEICEKPYIQIFVSVPDKDKPIVSEKIYAGMGLPHLSTATFGKENLIVVGGLNKGAHSSEMRIFKLKGEKIIPVCRKEFPENEENLEECVFLGDYGAPRVYESEKKEKTKVSECFYDTLEKIYCRSSYYEDGGFITKESDYFTLE